MTRAQHRYGGAGDGVITSEAKVAARLAAVPHSPREQNFSRTNQT